MCTVLDMSGICVRGRLAWDREAVLVCVKGPGLGLGLYV
jgi:hypothetical protein